MKIIDTRWIDDGTEKTEKKSANVWTITTVKTKRRCLVLECGHTIKLSDRQVVPKYNTECPECELAPRMAKMEGMVAARMAEQRGAWTNEGAHAQMLEALADVIEDTKAGHKIDLARIEALVNKFNPPPARPGLDGQS